MEWFWDLEDDGIWVREPLEGGGYLEMSLYWDEDRGHYNMALTVTDQGEGPPEVKSDKEWSKWEGKPQGPGGVEAFTLATKMMEDVEFEVGVYHRRYYSAYETTFIRVGAATEKLLRIYKRFLEPRGYTQVAAELLKEVR